MVLLKSNDGSLATDHSSNPVTTADLFHRLPKKSDLRSRALHAVSLGEFCGRARKCCPIRLADVAGGTGELERCQLIGCEANREKVSGWSDWSRKSVSIRNSEHFIEDNSDVTEMGQDSSNSSVAFTTKIASPRGLNS